jgi:hypothetical protein
MPGHPVAELVRQLQKIIIKHIEHFNDQVVNFKELIDKQEKEIVRILKQQKEEKAD